jgi:uncharacterized membrane-anchored protein
LQSRNTPVTGPRYWAGLCCASVLGANLGDFVSKVLHLGHTQGLAPEAVLFGLILLAENRLRTRTETYYWLAIVTMRAAATNLGDTMKHELAIPWLVALGGLAVALGAVQVAEKILAPRHPDEVSTGIPATNAFYWATMMIAGTLGTIGGDYVADVIGLDAGLGTVTLGAALAVALTARTVLGLVGRMSYWGVVVLVRCAGTTAGDYFAGRHGLNWGLPVSTSVWAVAMIALLLCWPTPRRDDGSALFAPASTTGG